MKKRVLVIYYSQSGQLCDVTAAIVRPLLDSGQVEVVFECLKPEKAYPFPWPFWEFFDTFPETVYDQPRPIADVSDTARGEFDLVVLAYQVWFLSPSQPMTAFLQSSAAAQILDGKPVMTLIACRNMWLMAQEKMKQHIQRLGGKLIDNVVLTDPAHSAATFISTPLWVLTGNKGPFFGGLVPEAGVSDSDIEAASRFGDALATQLPHREPDDFSPMLSDLGAVQVNDRLIASEKVASRSFHIWGGLLRALGAPGQILRRFVLVFYVIFLLTLILTVVPLSALIKRLLAPLTRERVMQQRRYFAAPSGESSGKYVSNE